MFIVHLVGDGEGCDYTIGCNRVVVELPAHLTTLEEAVEYVKTQEKPGCLSNYGAANIGAAVVYEVVNSAILNMVDIREERRREAAAKVEARERAKYEELKKRFG